MKGTDMLTLTASGALASLAAQDILKYSRGETLNHTYPQTVSKSLGEYFYTHLSN